MATPDEQSAKALYAEAMGLMGRGEDEGALAVFARIVERNANIPEVHFQIARIFLRNHQLPKALTHIRAAVTLKPGVSDIWKVYADIVRTLSNPDSQAEFRDALKTASLEKRERNALATSVDFIRRSKISLGKTSPAVFGRMVSALSDGQAGEAEDLAAAELRQNPRAPAIRNVLAAAQLAQGRFEEALATADNAIRLNPAYAEAYATRARILKAQGKVAEALHACNHALRIASGMPSALRLRSQCYDELGFSNEARKDLETLVALDGSDAEAHELLARHHYDDKDYLEAADLARKAIKRGHRTTGLYRTLAYSLSEMGHTEDALQKLEIARRLSPDSVLSILRIAELKQTLGRFDEAEAEFQSAIDLDPTWGEIYRVRLTSKMVDPGDPVIPTMQRYFADPSIADQRRAQFGFALAKVMEDQKRYDEVFCYLDQANAHMRRAFPYDITKRVVHVDRLIASFRTFDWSGAPAASTNRFAPIFVTGMPRSGTTLVEQIIASHSKVEGAGEVSVAPGRALSLLGREGGDYRDARDVTPEMLQGLGDGFETYMRALFPDADRITDKSIQTFAYIGLLKRAMPDAKFVVVRRDPRDNLLSIYKNVFPEGAHRYAYDVNDLAEYYRQFLRLVDFWRDVVPDWFHEIHYEDLVANPAEEAPKLIEACGLDWEDGCLEFHKTERRVKTLSVYQVRQPMYKSSTKAWERYGEDIQPLLDALGPDYADAAE